MLNVVNERFVAWSRKSDLIVMPKDRCWDLRPTRGLPFVLCTSPVDPELTCLLSPDTTCRIFPLNRLSVIWGVLSTLGPVYSAILINSAISTKVTAVSGICIRRSAKYDKLLRLCDCFRPWEGTGRIERELLATKFRWPKTNEFCFLFLLWASGSTEKRTNIKNKSAVAAC